MLNVIFNGLSWNQLIVSPKDFQTLVEIFAKATVVDARYLDTPAGSKVWDIVQPAVTLEARTKMNPRCTQAEFDIMSAEALAAKEAAKETACS